MKYSNWTKYDAINGTVNGQENFKGMAYTEFTVVAEEVEEVVTMASVINNAVELGMQEEDGIELPVEPMVALTSKKQVNYFKFLCHKYCISVHIPMTSKESRIKINAILKGVKSGRVKERATGYEGRDAECLIEGAYI